MVTVGLVDGGEAGNVIPESVKIGGTFRSLTSQGLLYLQERIKEVKHAITFVMYRFKISGEREINVIHLVQVIETQASVHGCNAAVDFMEERGMPHPVMINDETLYEHAKKVGEILVGEPNVELLPITMGAEDFSFYTKRFPAAMFTVGIKNETLKSDYPLHSPYFFIDEDAFPVGAAFYAAVAISYLDDHAVESETHLIL